MTIVFKVSDNVKAKMIKYYEDKKREKTPPYSIFQAQEADTIITLYNSNKVMFQGISADIDANIWIEMEKNLNNNIIDINPKKEKKEKDKTIFINCSTIGSDEVGTGDYFGPIVVTAAFVAKEDFNLLYDLGVKDSKKLTDEKIINIAPEIIKNIKHVTYILDNNSYNKFTGMGYNMNKIKAILHNKVLTQLVKQNPPYEKIVVDQFVYPKKYYEHIIDAKEKVNNITFTTHAEDKCLSVAAASIISRYIFLKQMKEMSKEVQTQIPKGAGIKVDEVAKQISDKHGFDYLKNIVKLNFKNTQKIKEMN